MPPAQTVNGEDASKQTEYGAEVKACMYVRRGERGSVHCVIILIIVVIRNGQDNRVSRTLAAR